ncbi:MAG: VOC family protein [Candidatus Planktophila sp.]|jgi:predicted enzyme related to lactoylglutathione lyase
MLSLQCITVDAIDPQALAKFWAEALGWSIGRDVNENEVWIERELDDPRQTGFPDILFLKNPDAKKVKNRLHLDLRPADQAAEVARLETLGAKQIDIGQSAEPTCTWVVMADPEGNEFCVLRALNS